VKKKAQEYAAGFCPGKTAASPCLSEQLPLLAQQFKVGDVSVGVVDVLFIFDGFFEDFTSTHLFLGDVDSGERWKPALPPYFRVGVASAFHIAGG